MADSILLAAMRVYGGEFADRDLTEAEVDREIAVLHTDERLGPYLSLETDEAVLVAYRARYGSPSLRRDRAVGAAMKLFDRMKRTAKLGEYVDDATMTALREKLNEITAITKSNEGK